MKVKTAKNLPRNCLKTGNLSYLRNIFTALVGVNPRGAQNFLAAKLVARLINIDWTGKLRESVSHWRASNTY